MNILEQIIYYLSFDFVKYAIIAGIFISLCCAILGVTLVLKRYSMIGDGLSHVAFGAMAVAMVLSVTDIYIMLPATIIVAVLLLQLNKNSKVKSDSAIAMISVSALAFGYFIINLFSGSANVAGDVCTTLFGSTSILTLSNLDVLLCFILSILVLCFFIYFHNKVFGVTFDESFSKATGTNTALFNTIISVIIGIVIVLAMKLVGTLLISALIVFPALSAIRIFKSYKMVVIFSCIISVICTIIGLLMAILFGTPVGATIVLVDLVAYFICWLIEFAFKGAKV